MKKSAKLSRDGVYRYELRRTWDEDLPSVAFIGLNPSTADGKIDDPTIRRCVNFAKSWGYGELIMVNLFAYRATNPLVMRAADKPVGTHNNRYLLRAAIASDLIICAWGKNEEGSGRAREVINLLSKYDLHCLDKTTSGSPKHPLYLKSDLKPIKYI